MTPVSQPAPSPAPAARSTLRRLVLRGLLLGLVLLLALVATLAVLFTRIPALARGPGAHLVSQVIGRPVTLQAMSIDPWHLQVRLEGLQVGESPRLAGPPFAELAALEVQLAADSLWHGYPHIRHLILQQPTIRLARGRDGSLSVQDLFDRFLKKPSTGASPALVLEDLQLHGGTLRWDDHRTGGRHALTGLEVALPWFSTRPQDTARAVEPQLYGRLDDRLLVLYASAAARGGDEALAAHFEVADLRLPDYVDLVPIPGGIHLRDGRFDARMDVHVRTRAGALPQLVLNGRFDLRQLDVREDASAPTPLLALQRLDIPVTEFDLDARSLHLGQLTVQGFQTRASRAADGSLDWVHLLQKVESARPAQRTDEGHAPPAGLTRVRIDGLDFADGRGTWDDAATGAPVHVALTRTSVRLGALRWPEAGAIPLQVDLVGDHQEHARLDGVLHLPGPILDGQLTLERVDVQRGAPYFAGALPVRVDSAAFGAQAHLLLGVNDHQPFAAIDHLQFNLPRLEVRKRDGDNLMVRLRDFRIEGLQADSRQGSLQVNRIAWGSLQTGYAAGSGAAWLTGVTGSQATRQLQVGALQVSDLALPANGHGTLLRAEGLTADLTGQVYSLHNLVATDLALPSGLAVASVTLADARAELTTAHYRAGLLNAGGVQAPGQNQIASLSLRNADIALGAQHRIALADLDGTGFALVGRIQLPTLQAHGGQIDLDAKTFAIDSVRLADGQLDLQRQADGSFDSGTLRQLLQAIPGYVPPAATAPVPVPPAAAIGHDSAAGPPTDGIAGWQGRLGDLQIDRLSGHLRDLSHRKPAEVRWQNLQLALHGLSTRSSDAATLAFSSELNQSGRISLKGRLRAAPLDGRLHLVLTSLHLPDVLPWLPVRLPILFPSGEFALDGTLRASGTFAQPAFLIEGSSSMTGVKILNAATAEPILGWETLAGQEVRINTQPLDVAIGTIRLVGLSAGLALQADGSLNLSRLMGSASPAPSGGTATAAGQHIVEPPSALAFPVSIGRIDLENGRVAFSDSYVQPHYNAELSQLQGSLTGLANRTGTRASLDVSGRLGAGAALQVSGQINPLLNPVFLDVRAQVHDFELGPLTSYSTRFTGFPIERGKLSLDLRYRLEDGHITAGNSLRLDQFTLGERRQVPGMRDLPLDMAVSLLTDADGVIQVDLPIEGTLSDPQFNLGGIIAELVGRTVERAMTAPFRWLGSLFDGAVHGDGQSSWIPFASGSAALDEAARASLARLAKAFQGKPALRLNLRGTASAAQDAVALQDALLDTRLRAQKVRQLVRAGQAVGPLDAVQWAATERPALLAAAWKAELASTPAPAPAVAIDPADGRLLERALRARLPIGPEQLASLANARAQAAQEWLTATGGIDPARVFLRAVAPEDLMASAAGGTESAAHEASPTGSTAGDPGQRPPPARVDVTLR